MQPSIIDTESDAARFMRGPDADAPFRLGIIGLGAIGAEMLRVASMHPEFTVLRACDVRHVVLDRLRPAYPAVSFTTSALEVVESTDLDAVYVATPPAFHADVATAAIRAGKAVLCEKPLAITRADGEQMRQAADNGGVATGVNFALSDRNATLEIERSLHAGEVGKVLGVDVRLHFPRWPRDFQKGATWLAGREQGGFVREVFSHFAYLTDRLLGPLRPVDVSADYPSDDPGSSEVAARGLLRCGDVPVHLSAFAGAPGPEVYEWTLWGTHRSYLLRNWDELFVSAGDEWVPVHLHSERGSEATRLSLFADAIRGQASRDLADFAAGFRVQEAVEAFHRTTVAG